MSHYLPSAALLRVHNPNAERASRRPPAATNKERIGFQILKTRALGSNPSPRNRHRSGIGIAVYSSANQNPRNQANKKWKPKEERDIELLESKRKMKNVGIRYLYI